MRQALTKASENEVKSTAGLSLKGLSLGSESRVRANSSTSKEIVRRSVIQSTFRNLRRGDGRDDLLTNSAIVGFRRNKPKYTEQLEFERDLKRLLKNRLVHSAESILRGDVIEMSARFSADRTYDWVSALSSTIEIVKGREELLGIDPKTFTQIVPLVEVIDALLVGLVPVVGISQDFGVIEVRGQEYLVDLDLIDPKGRMVDAVRPLELVGVTEFSSYWKDLRRVLFNDSIYTAYMRVEDSRLRETWTPVKLADVLRRVSVDIDSMIDVLQASFGEAGALPEPDAQAMPSAADLFIDFAHRLALLEGVPIDDSALTVAVAEAVTIAAPLDDVDLRREAFDRIVKLVDTESGSSADRDLVRVTRDAAYADFNASSLVAAGAPLVTGVSSLAELRGRKLEVEFIAIYW